MSKYEWSTTAADNDDADGNINWAEGQLPSTVNNSARAMMRAEASYLQGVGGALTTGGTGSAYTLTLADVPTAYTTSMMFLVKFNVVSASTTPTINVNSLGAKTIVMWDGTALPSSTYIPANAYGFLNYDGTNMRVFLPSQAYTQGATDVAIADGGTGASTAADARTNLAVPGLNDANSFSNSNSFLGTVTLQNSDAGAAASPSIILDRASASPAANDILAQLSFRGRDSGGATLDYAAINTLIGDPTDTSEDGRLRFYTVASGTLDIRLNLGAGGWMQGATGTDQGAGTFNATALYENGTALSSKYSPLAGSSSITTVGTITSGTWNGTDIAVTAGGTGASTAADARTNLGITTGSFTPTLTFGGASTGITYGNQVGNYVKIGQDLIFNLVITLSSKGSATGAAVIEGLPFTLSSSVTIPVFVLHQNLTSVSDVFLGGLISTDIIALYENAGSGTLLALQDTKFTDSTQVRVIGFYKSTT